MSDAVEKLATPTNRLQVAVIAGADHIYSGLHDILAGRIAAWLKRVATSAGELSSCFRAGSRVFFRYSARLFGTQPALIPWPLAWPEWLQRLKSFRSSNEYR